MRTNPAATGVACKMTAVEQQSAFRRARAVSRLLYDGSHHCRVTAVNFAFTTPNTVAIIANASTFTFVAGDLAKAANSEEPKWNRFQ